MTIRALDNRIQTVNLGKQGENKARQIVFDISEFREHYGAGTAMLAHKRQRDAAPYIVDTTASGNLLIWDISSTDTEQSGTGYAELRYCVDDLIAKSIVFRTCVIPSITGDTVIPPALQSWYDAMIEYINGFDVSPETVAQAVEAYFSENPVSVPVNTSDLNNDAGFITSADIPAIPAASSDSPQMDGTASPGSSAAFSRADHVHPSDDTKVDKVLGKGLSTCDYTNEDRIKLSGVASGAEVNVITAIEKNGSPVSPDSNRHVNITVPTKISDLTNDSGFVNASGAAAAAPVQSVNGQTGAVSVSIPSASSTTPSMDGTASAGLGTTWARGDHVHPSDTSKVDKVNGKGLSTEDYSTEEKAKLDGIEEDAQVNVIERIKVNGSFLTVSGKAVNITVPTKVSDLTNDSDFATNAEVAALVEQSANALILDFADLTENAAQGQCYGTCDTAAATAAKTVSFSGYQLCSGGIVAVKFTYAVPASATLNINSRGAKAIYFRGAAITADVIKAGDTATMMYDGTYYQLIAVDRWQTDIATLASRLDALVDGDEVSY